MILLGVDPSFTRAGVTIVNTDTMEIIHDKIEGRMSKNFDNNFKESLDRCKRLSNLLKGYKVDYALSEHPFPGGISSPGLFMLDGMLMYTLYLMQTANLYIVHPSYLKHLHGKNYEKSDSIKLAKELKVIYLKHGYSFNKNKITHDESESFLFVTRLMVLLNINPSLVSEIVKLNKGFASKKEKPLFERR